MDAMPEIATLSQITKEAPTVGNKLKDGPILLTARAERFGVLVSVEQWNSIANELSRLQDMEEVNELLRLEIDRLKAEEPESEPWDIDELERDAGRV